MRIILSLGLCLAFVLQSPLFAQTNLPQIPAEAFMVARVSGSSLQSKMSIEELEQLPLFEDLKLRLENNGANSVQDLGLDFDKDAYLYAHHTDSVTYMVWMMEMKNIEQFKSYFYKQWNMNPEEQGPYTSYDTSIDWNEESCVFILSEVNDSYVRDHESELRARYPLLDEKQDEYYLSTEPEFHDEAIVPDFPDVEEVLPMEELEVVEEIIESSSVEEDSLEQLWEDDAKPQIEAYDIYDPYGYSNYSYGLNYQEKEKLAGQWREIYLRKMRESKSKSVLGAAPWHSKLKASKSDAVAYVDYDAYMQVILREFMGAAMMYPGPYQSGMMQIMQMAQGSSVYSELNFEENRMLWDMDFTSEGEMGALQMKMLDSKLSKNYLKYVNSEELIAYYSLAFDTESLLDYYAQILGSYAGAAAGEAEAGQVVSDLLSLLVDEEAVAELFPGSMLFTFSDISTQMVEYVTYDYDENWNQIEVKGEKEETLPSFLAMVETGRVDLLKKLLDIAAEKAPDMTLTDFGYRLDDGPFPVYLILKNDMLLFGNDKQQMQTIHKGQFKSQVSGEHKKAMLSNNSVMYFDAATMIERLKEVFPTGSMAEQIALFDGKAEDIMIKAGRKGSNMTRVRAEMNIPEGEKNALAYIFGLLNTYYKYETGR